MEKDIDSLGLAISREWPISLPIMIKVSMFLEVISNNTTTNVPNVGDGETQIVVKLSFEETL